MRNPQSILPGVDRRDEENISTLPFTCFEEYLFCDDSPSYPMSLTVRLRFVGFLEPAAFENALVNVLQRHPLLRATVSRKRFGGPAWKVHPEWRPIVHWHAQGDDNGFPETPFMDLTREPGIRIWVLDNDKGNDLVMQVHHCCTDGRGMMSFIEDLLISYTTYQGDSEERIPLRQLEPHGLRKRGAPDLRARELPKAVFLQIGVLNGIRKFFMRSPAPVAGSNRPCRERTSPATRTVPLFFRFEHNETREIVSSAKRYGATLNELLLRDLYLAIGAWRERKGIGLPGDWLRFSIPVDLRKPGKDTLPMANSISMVFLDIQQRELESRESLLKSIRDYMVYIKRCYRKYTFLFSVAGARILPGGMTRLTRDDTCYATTCFSNVGRVLDRTPLPLSGGRIVAGNVLLESLDAVAPPLRRQMDVACTAYTYAGSLQLVLSYNSLVLPDEDAGELLEIYVQKIRRTVEESSTLRARNKTPDNDGTT